MANGEKSRAIRLFNRFNLAATVVGILNILLHYGSLRDLAISKGASPAGPFMGMALITIQFLFFWYFIFRRESKIAKWAYLAITVFGIAMLPFNFSEVLAIGSAYAIVDVVAFLFQLAASAMLLQQAK